MVAQGGLDPPHTPCSTSFPHLCLTPHPYTHHVLWAPTPPHVPTCAILQPHTSLYPHPLSPHPPILPCSICTAPEWHPLGWVCLEFWTVDSWCCPPCDPGVPVICLYTHLLWAALGSSLSSASPQLWGTSTGSLPGSLYPFGRPARFSLPLLGDTAPVPLTLPPSAARPLPAT